MRFGYRFTVDRHGLRPRDDKSGGLPFNLQNSPFTLQSSLFLPWLLLLETNTEAKAVAAVARGVVGALGGTQVRPGVVPGTTA